MEWDQICQHCQTLEHTCYGFAKKVCGQCQCDKKTFQDVVVMGTLHFLAHPDEVLTHW